MILALVCICLPLSAASGLSKAKTYAVGQVWAYKTRPQDKGSLIKIQLIEQLPLKDSSWTIYHISMNGVKVDGQAAPIGIAHLPVTQETLDKSVTKIVKSKAVFQNYGEGLAEWRRAEGGAFTVSLSEIAGIVVGVMPKNAT
jgi:hypothetical protein